MSIAGIDRDRFGPVLVDDRLQLRCDFVERLVGGDGFILTVGSTPLRVKDPIGRIMPFRHRPPLRTGISAIYRLPAIADKHYRAFVNDCYTTRSSRPTYFPDPHYDLHTAQLRPLYFSGGPAYINTNNNQKK